MKTAWDTSGNRFPRLYGYRAAKLIAVAVVWTILSQPSPLAAAGTVNDLPGGGGGRVSAVIDGDTVRLRDGEADIRLIGLQAPKLSLGRTGFKDWPLADESRAALSALVMDREVTVRLGTSSRDRNGRILAHLVRDDGLWVQGEMLRQGWARLYTFPDNRRLAAEMRVLETEARAARRGIWSHPFFAVRQADDAALFGDRDTYQIVVGRVVDAARTKDRLYLNFGTDIRSDFTVSVAKANWPVFDQAAMDLMALEGAEIEVRGWITLRGGPAIEANHPDQIEILARR